MTEPGGTVWVGSQTELFSFDGKALKHEWTIDFLAENLGAPHQMRFGAYGLYGLSAPAEVAGR